MPETALRFDDVHFAYENASISVEVIRSLSFDVSSHEIFGLVGPSGCGKTTILKLAADLVTGSTSGSIVIDGTSPAQARAERRIAILFQRPILLPWRNVLENVLLPSQIADDPPAPSKAKAMELLDLAGVADFSDRPIHELSGGMQQRVSLVRSLMSEPRLLYLDEPFISLDEVVKEDLLQLTQRVAQSLSLTVLHVSHSLEDSVLLCDRVAVLAPRPTTVSQLIDISLDRPRHYQQRIEPEFLEALSSVRNAVHANGRNALKGGLQ
ncbi:MAG: ATP-binding cassette domain-containing protein [Planctomycetes bacterium]|nr:ATP-binding cassette domain-containing protein [Planctomycetota bacterium]